MSNDKETRQFEAEVSQILKLMVHSMYSNQEVFLRELISNASDAIDKLRFEALSDEELFEGQTDLKIEVEVDKEAATVTIRDTGIGMSRQEVTDNIGTIARSGTRQFLENLTGDQKKDSRLIGQFGVGFYSAFIVSDKVVLTTRRAGEKEAVRWESDGEGEYSLEVIEKEARGTEIVLYLREECSEFLEAMRLERVIRRYSDHISFPIFLIEESTETDEETPEEDGEESGQDIRQVNQASALWTRKSWDIEDEEYQSFYKHVARAFDEPLHWIHNQVEGRLKFTLLLYLPTAPPFDFQMPDQERAGGVKLYVKRVFVLDDAEMFLPRYLRFIRGVVDSDDLPLNVSRELLQDNRVVATIRSTATKKVLKMLQEISKDEEKYQTFWSSFGPILKEGIVEEPSKKEEVAALLRFASTAEAEAKQTVSLDAYKERMKEGQEAIYYVTADTYAAAVASPHLEIFKAQGVEVLVLTDAIDEWVVSHLREFDETPLRSVDRGALDLDSLGNCDEEQEPESESPKVDEEWKEVVEAVKSSLGDAVKEVRMSKRLTDSPSCLVREEWEMGSRMRRILTRAGEEVPDGTPTLELNPTHPLVVRLKSIEADELTEWAQLFLDQASLSEGADLEAPAVFVRRLNDLMGRLALEKVGEEETAGI